MKNTYQGYLIMKLYEIEVPNAIYEFMVNTEESFDWNEYLLDKITDIMATYLDSHPEEVDSLTNNLKSITQDFNASLIKKNDEEEKQ